MAETAHPLVSCIGQEGKSRPSHDTPGTSGSVLSLCQGHENEKHLAIGLNSEVMFHTGHDDKSAFDFVHGENAFAVMAGEIDDDKRLRSLV